MTEDDFRNAAVAVAMIHRRHTRVAGVMQATFLRHGIKTSSLRDNG